MSQSFIPLSVPNFSGNEKAYVEAAVVSEWVSTGGSLVGEFEQKIAEYVGMPRAVACNSGTAGLHLALLAAGVSRGKEVIVPTLTFIAAVNPVRYVGAEPVFIGCDDSWCIDPDAVEEFCKNSCEMRSGRLYNKTSGAHVMALEVVHVFGNMADMPRLVRLAKEYNLVLIEDATEALGTRYTAGEYAGKMAGTMGDVGVYSFNGNKLITTGSGGMLVSNCPVWAQHAKHLSTQAKVDEVQFFHDEVGYNYRLTNLQAALGLAQLEQIEDFINHKHKLFDFYTERLDGKNGLQVLPFNENIRANKWFFSVYLQDARHDRDQVIAALAAQQIQTRPVWALIHEQKPYCGCECFGEGKAQDLRGKIINIPCSTNLTMEEAQRVADALLAL